MKKLITDEYSKFECIGGKCPDTCCCGWMVLIDQASEKKYRETEGEFGELLRKSIKTHDDGRVFFEMQKNGRCPFLNEDNLCRIYRTLGPDAMCATCRVYPRDIYIAGDIQFATVSISCPEAGRMILGKKQKQQYAYHEDETEVIDDNNTDWERFNTAIRTFYTVNGILQERDFFIRERLAAVLIYARQVQEISDKGGTTDALNQLFQDPDQYAAITAQVLEDRRAIAEKLSFVRVFIDALLKTKRESAMTTEFRDMLEYIAHESNREEDIWQRAFKRFDEEVEETETEQLLVYLLFRHFMKKYEVCSVWESTVLMIAFYSAYRCLIVLHYMSKGEFPNFNWRVLLVARISRYFEHSRDVWEALSDNMRAEGIDTLGKMLHLVN